VTKPVTKSVTKTASRKPAIKAAATPSPAFTLNHDMVAQRAHDLYVQSGHQGHRQEEFWLEAERQLRGGLKF
jgi:hypothetical protein